MGPADHTRYRRERAAGLVKLARRAGQIVSQSHLESVAAGNDRIVRSFAGKAIGEKLASLGEPARPSTTYQFRVVVPDRRFELDGPGIGDRDIGPSRLDANGLWTLVASAEHPHATKEATAHWAGVHPATGRTALRIDRDGIGSPPDRTFRTINLPTA